MSVTLGLSVDGLTIQAAWIAAMAVAALALVGWRKPARAWAKSRRAPSSPRHPAARPGSATAPDRIHQPVVLVERRPVPMYRPPGPIRRLTAALASGGIAVLTGAIIAVVVSFAMAYAVVTLTGLLGR